MATITLPELGENVSAAVVSRVLVAVGDTVRRDQPVLELETDKATVEVPSSADGVVTDIRVKAGDKLRTGDVVLSLGSASGSGTAPVVAPESEAVGATPPIASVEATPASPNPVAVHPALDHAQAQASVVPARVAAVRPSGNILASPGVRRLARELGVDPAMVAGSGPDGRISQEDIKAHLRHQVRPRTMEEAPPLPDLARWGTVERVAMSGVRRATAAHLSQAWRTIPHVTQHEKADITELDALRRRFAPGLDAHGRKLTMTAILVKVLATAVQRFPQFNASVDMAASELVYRRYINVGVAVDTERGLLVPVVRDVDQKRIADIAADIQTLAARARDKSITAEEMSGAGISLSNLGGLGGTHFTPIVNWPEVAILGVSRSATEPVHVDGAFQPRLLLPLSLSYDHRAIDGADGVRFLRFVVDTLEHPFQLAL